jgi:DNA invertase Pin-like site-specific DNA recombinase
VRIDRLARSLSHLLEIVETLRAKGAYFRSINDPIDGLYPFGRDVQGSRGGRIFVNCAMWRSGACRQAIGGQ